MNPKIKVFITVVIILASLALAGGGFYLYQKEKARNAELEDKLDELNTKIKITESKFQEAQKLLNTFDAKLKEATAQIQTLNSKLAQEQMAKEEALASIEEMRVDLGMQKDLRSDLEQKLSKAQADVRNIQDKLGVMQTEKEALENKVTALEEKANVELGKIVVNTDTTKGKAGDDKAKKKTATEAVKKKTGVAAVTSDGKVLVVNKEYNFAVISVGSRDGVGIGDLYSVYRGNSLLGDIKVEKVQDSMSAAGFVTSNLKNTIREGDTISKKK